MTRSNLNRNILSFFLLTFISVFSLQAQSFDGRIISSQGGEPVPFANVMVKGTTVGVASDMDGLFAITIPSEQKNGTLIISAVGFTNKEMPVAELKTNKENIIVIKTQEYNIDEVDVQAESRVLYGAVKKCSQNIPDNYINEAYSCSFDYTNNDKKASGIISDLTGYERTSFRETYKTISYQFTPNENGEINAPYFQGKTNMEDLLSFDLVRTVGNVIDKVNVYDFELSLIPNTDEKIWLIHFKAKHPKLYNTGEAHITAYEGELYIIKENFAITKAVLRGKADKRSIHGKSIAVAEESSQFISDISYEAATSYTLDDGKYRLAKVELTENYTSQGKQKKMVESSLVINKKKNEFVKIEGRDYFVKKW